MNERTIQTLCGQTSFRKGEVFYRTGKVTLALSETGSDRVVYEADVKDNGSCRVQIVLGPKGEIEASCACSVHFSFDKYCKHVAAVLLQLMASQQEETEADELDSEFESADSVVEERPNAGAKANAEEMRLVNRVLDLFKHEAGRPPAKARALFESRMQLEAEFLVAPYVQGSRRSLLCTELRIGRGRRYAVPDIREFISRFERGEAYAFSRHFTYDPAIHCFAASEEAILAVLEEIRRNEKLQREAAGALYTGEIYEPKTLPIPPYAWEKLAPKLTATPYVKLLYNDKSYEGARYSDEPLPLQFSFDQASGEGYQLAIRGLKDLLVIEAYGMALSEGCIVPLKAEECKQLAQLQKIMDGNEAEPLRIPAYQMEPFMEKVVPGIIKLGSVHMSRAVSERIVQSPLHARIYLDRVRERLLVGLEFQYGDIVINPLEEEGTRRGESRILIREGERELRIMELIESASFAKTEGGYFTQDEESEFEFLHNIVPELEKLAKIYATTTVKERLHTGNPLPVIIVERNERTNWLELSFQMDGIPESEIRGVIQSLADKRKFHRLKTGALLPLDTAELQEMIRFLNETGMLKGEIPAGLLQLPLAHSLNLLDERDRERSGVVRLGKSIRMLLADLRNPDHLDFPVPDSLVPVLRDYQVYGYQWMKTLAHYGFGGILADEMGLGKTVQSIAFLVSVLPEIRARTQPALIVAPSSLLYNWRNELRKFAPELRCVIADGTKSMRNAILKDAEGVDVIITSYPLLRRDIEGYKALSFHTLILDEAQTFKNFATQTAQSVKVIRAEYRFALTGTPIENSLEELWSIYNVVFPGLFPHRRAFGELSREAIAGRVRPFLLRRLKREVLGELPEKIESLQVSELLPEQKKLYIAYLAKLRQEALKHLDQDDFQRNRIRFLAGLTRLRQICCHPGLFIEGYSGSSAKFEQLLETIEDCRSAGRRVLVFSQFTEMLGLISRELGYRGVPFFYLDGSTPASDRVELCNRFNEGERDLFLISLKAGGTGLNLTGADTVVLYDLWWNPAVEQQAEDRAHRIGQKKVVQVIRFIAQDTVEEKMYTLQQKKKTMIAEVLKSGEEALTALTEQDLRELLAIE